MNEEIEIEKEVLFTINDSIVEVEYSEDLKVEDMILVFVRIVLDLRHNGVSDDLIKGIIDTSITVMEDDIGK